MLNYHKLLQNVPKLTMSVSSYRPTGSECYDIFVSKMRTGHDLFIFEELVDLISFSWCLSIILENKESKLKLLVKIPLILPLSDNEHNCISGTDVHFTELHGFFLPRKFNTVELFKGPV